MSDETNVENMAERLIDMWQSKFKEFVTDPQMIMAMGELFRLWSIAQAGMHQQNTPKSADTSEQSDQSNYEQFQELWKSSPFMGFIQNAFPGFDPTGTITGTDDKQGTTGPSADASTDGDASLAAVSDRLERLEDQLAELRDLLKDK